MVATKVDRVFMVIMNLSENQYFKTSIDKHQAILHVKVVEYKIEFTKDA